MTHEETVFRNATLIAETRTRSARKMQSDALRQIWRTAVEALTRYLANRPFRAGHHRQRRQ